jgi:hypothetical protein
MHGFTKDKSKLSSQCMKAVFDCCDCGIKQPRHNFAKPCPCTCYVFHGTEQIPCLPVPARCVRDITDTGSLSTHQKNSRRARTCSWPRTYARAVVRWYPSSTHGDLSLSRPCPCCRLLSAMDGHGRVSL